MTVKADRALYLCQQGHSHRGSDAVRICNAATRMVQAKRLQAADLLAELRPVMQQAAERNRRRLA